MTNVQDWKAEALSAFSGLRGLCILWVFWQHSTMKIQGSFMSDPLNNNRANFNTASFLILTGFTTYMQQRGQKVRYSSWMLRNYFSLIPLNIMAILVFLVPVFYLEAGTANISTAWQAYMFIANVCGFGFLSSAQTFGGMAGLDKATLVIDGASTALYFGSMLFVLFGVYALFHWALTSSKTLRSLFQKSCIPALLIAILMIALSFLLGALDANPITAMVASGQIQLLPMLMLGVCAAELRHQMPAKMQAVMGYWLTIDALFAAFLAVTFCPYSYTASNLTAEGFKDPMSVALLTMQQIFFCLLLMALSCQVFHKKRSIVVHFVLRRSLVHLFAKYSYTFYLFALPVLFVYYPTWVTMLMPNGMKEFNWATVGWLQWLLMLLVSLAASMVAQWWQDEYVTSVYLSVRQCIDDGHIWNLWTSEQNPLCWHNCAEGAQSEESECDLTVNDKSLKILSNLESQEHQQVRV